MLISISKQSLLDSIYFLILNTSKYIILNSRNTEAHVSNRFITDGNTEIGQNAFQAGMWPNIY